MGNSSTLILNLGLAGADLLDGDILYIDSNGVLQKNTTVEAVNCVGICVGAVKSGKPVAVLVQGRALVRYLVEDTDGAGTYKAPILSGDLLSIAGKAGGTYVAGQALSKVTLAIGKPVARAIGAAPGTTTGDTYGLIDAVVNFI